MMKSWPRVLFRFLGGAGAAGVICATALDREVWRAQLIVLVTAAVVAGLVCAMSPAVFKALRDHWQA